MSPILTLAASLAATFVSWYVFSLIPWRTLRGVLRATLIALLCSPGILIGHGFAVVPSLFALSVQPSIFTLGPMLLVWIIALAVIFGVPALRNDRRAWPPAASEIFLTAYAAKFVYFGLIAAVLRMELSYVDRPRAMWVVALQYGLFFAGAAVNLTLCQWATRTKQARPLVIPLAFAAPAMIVAHPTVPFIWYAGGAVGGLIGSGRRHIAAWVALGASALLLVNALFRTYLAATAAAHVTIGGGVAGNAAMAALYAVAGFVAWGTLRHHAPAGERSGHRERR